MSDFIYEYGQAGSMNSTNNRDPPRVNPMVPNSIGGLLAEEWTIDPMSILPSFLERTMMDEARRSGIESLKAVFLLIEECLSRLAHSEQPETAPTTTTSTATTNGATTTTILWQRLGVLRTRWVSKLSQFLVKRFIRPYGPEIRMLLLYFLERHYLLSSSAATMSESIYGGKRVQLGLEKNNVVTSTPTAIGASGVGNNNAPGARQQQRQQPQQRNLHPMSKQNAIRLAVLTSFGPYLEERSSWIIQTIMRWLATTRGNGIGGTTIINIDRNNTTTMMVSAITTTTWKNKVSRILQVVWPFLRMTTHGTFLLYRWRYLLGRSVYYDPYSNILNLVLRRLTQQDQEPQQLTDKVGATSVEGEPTTDSHSKTTTVSSSPKNIPLSLSDVLLRFSGGSQRVIAGMVSTMIILSWAARVRSIRENRHRRQNEVPNAISANNYNNNNTAISTAFSSDGGLLKPILPPPPPQRHDTRLSSAKYGSHQRRIKNIAVDNLTPKVCPVCQEPRINPTASTGGYVFCLKCLLNYIRHTAPLCPITGKSCPETSIIRLYEPRNATTPTS